MAHQQPDDQSHSNDSAAGGDDYLADGLAWPLFSQESRCLCGALAETSQLCVKCQARAAWAQRQAYRGQLGPENGPRRRRRCDARGTKSHRPEPDRPSHRRPRGRRPGH
jgi:hypothetical protein